MVSFECVVVITGRHVSLYAKGILLRNSLANPWESAQNGHENANAGDYPGGDHGGMLDHSTPYDVNDVIH